MQNKPTQAVQVIQNKPQTQVIQNQVQATRIQEQNMRMQNVNIQANNVPTRPEIQTRAIINQQTKVP